VALSGCEMKAALTCQTFVNFCQATRHYSCENQHKTNASKGRYILSQKNVYKVQNNTDNLISYPTDIQCCCYSWRHFPRSVDGEIKVTNVSGSLNIFQDVFIVVERKNNGL
jgi:hypothetical protein